MQKILRTLAKITLALLLLFLSLGLFFPSVSYETKVTVDVPLDEAFEQFTNRQAIVEYIPEITSVAETTQEPTPVGRQYKIISDYDGDRSEMLETILAYEEDALYQVSTVAGVMTKEDSYTFEQAGANTIIQGKHEARATNYYARCFFAIAGKMFKNIDQDYLDRFGAWVEE